MPSSSPSSERGAALVEYALLVALVAVVSVGAIAAVSGAVENTFEDALCEIDPSSSPDCPAPVATGTCPANGCRSGEWTWAVDSSSGIRTNTSFDTATTDTGLADGWGIWNTADNQAEQAKAQYRVELVPGADGGQSQRVEVINANNGEAVNVASHFGPVTPGQTYSLTATGRANAPVGATIGMYFGNADDPDDNHYVFVSQNFGTESGEISGQVTVPPNMTHGWYVFRYDAPENGDWMEVDQVSISPGPASA
ncbi:MAG: hypothetical protein AAGD35_01190 [Actinomycetota bacterium]